MTTHAMQVLAHDMHDCCRPRTPKMPKLKISLRCACVLPPHLIFGRHSTFRVGRSYRVKITLQIVVEKRATTDKGTLLAIQNAGTMCVVTHRIFTWKLLRPVYGAAAPTTGHNITHCCKLLYHRGCSGAICFCCRSCTRI